MSLFRFSNEAENRSFAKQVSDLFVGNLRTDDVLRIGTTPFCLRIVGADAIPLGFAPL